MNTATKPAPPATFSLALAPAPVAFDVYAALQFLRLAKVAEMAARVSP